MTHKLRYEALIEYIDELIKFYEKRQDYESDHDYERGYNQGYNQGILMQLTHIKNVYGREI
jgi:hypothetical protein